jgi:hypothetical protein
MKGHTMTTVPKRDEWIWIQTIEAHRLRNTDICCEPESKKCLTHNQQVWIMFLAGSFKLISGEASQENRLSARPSENSASNVDIPGFVDLSKQGKNAVCLFIITPRKN